MTERLTSLAAVKDWLGIQSSASDSLLTDLIDSASRFVLNYMNRPSLACQSYTERFRGNGKYSVLLKNWPIISVESVGINGNAVPASTFDAFGKPTDGYSPREPLEAPNSVDLFGYMFLMGLPCQVVYTAGYRTSETGAIPVDPYQLTPSSMGQWTGDLSVTIGGVAAVKVTGTPTAGQYSVDDWGTYTFANADVGEEAVITYSYCPPDLSHCVCEIVGEWYNRKDRIGVKSKSLGGQETVTFTTSDMNDSIRNVIQQYRNVVPM